MTITRDGETEPVKQTTLDEAGSVYLPRFDGDGRLITYRVKVESNEQTDGLFYASGARTARGKSTKRRFRSPFYGRRENPERRLFLHQAAGGANHHEAACRCERPEKRTNVEDHGSGYLRRGRRALSSQTVELTTDGEQNEASQTLSLCGWDENGHVVTYTVVEAATEGYAVTYSEESVTLDDGTGQDDHRHQHASGRQDDLY